jgi:CheY-like chemotaxis protein
MGKILIAEDDPSTCKVLTKILEPMGHQVFISPNGRHAWETLRVNPTIPLLITDVMMPEMDGRQLVGVIRGHSEYRDLPIIIMSAVVGPKEVANLLDMGATLFMPKPLNVADVRENVARCLE